MKDVECPYCEKWQEINHDDGFSYAEDEIHQQECSDCGKVFTFTTSISFNYESEKAPCLNGGEHKWGQSHTVPRQHTKMHCMYCGDRREPTPNEWKDILK